VTAVLVDNFHPHVLEADNSRKDAWVPEINHPVEVDAGRVLLDPAQMDTSRPYGFEFLGRPFCALKRDDGSIDVFYLP
jgi:hypothetical protein